MMTETSKWSSNEDSSIKRRLAARPVSVFLKEQQLKARELRMKDMRAALLEHLREVPEAVLDKKLHLKPFAPPSFYPKPVERFEDKPVELLLEDGSELAAEKRPKDLYRDAETGEVISWTRAKWSAVEGRVEFTGRSIIDMGGAFHGEGVSSSSCTGC